jgi:hypothetical protein
VFCKWGNGGQVVDKHEASTKLRVYSAQKFSEISGTTLVEQLRGIKIFAMLILTTRIRKVLQTATLAAGQSLERIVR